MQLHRPTTLRDLFVQTASNPLSLLSEPGEKLHLLRGLDFAIHAGDRVGLVGVNGAGKTSLCRCIAQIYRPTRGTVEINGAVRALFDTSIGFYPDLTGRENGELVTQLMYPGVDLSGALEEAFAFSELGRFLDAPYKFYSNGMQARLALSIATIKPADLLILDEVFDGADQFFREKISKRVQKLIEDSGASIFISHSFDQIRRVCNRVIVLSSGTIFFDGTPDEAESKYLEINGARGGKPPAS